VHELVLDWFEENKRDLPWRNATAWGVMVSEFMLQQTPVNRVLPIWQQWLARWPTPADLAAVKKSEVITAWGRLGYPRRALRLYESAKIIATHHGNQVPSTYEELLALPGVGDYTAAAICAFAYNQPMLVLDINIRRLFARLLDGEQTPSAAPTARERALRFKLIPQRSSDGAKWAAATMELGALICTAKNPTCDLCPVRELCAWRKNGYPASEIIKKSQSWHGTDRQCRGTIVQALRESPALTQVQLQKLWHDPSQLELALKTLLADGLIETTGKRFKLAD